MKKNYIQPSIKAVTMRVGGHLCDPSFTITKEADSTAYANGAWGKEDNEENGEGFGW